MDARIHQLTIGLSAVLIISGGGLAAYDLSKAPQTKAAIAPIIPEDGEYTELNANGSKWALVKIWDADKKRGLELYNPNVDPSVNLEVIETRIMKEGNISGFILEQQTTTGQSIYGYAFVADTPSNNPKHYRIVKITQKWAEQNPDVFSKLMPKK